MPESARPLASASQCRGSNFTPTSSTYYLNFCLVLSFQSTPCCGFLPWAHCGPAWRAPPCTSRPTLGSSNAGESPGVENISCSWTISFCSPSQHPLSSLVSYSTRILPVWSKVVTCCYSDQAAIIFTGAIDSDDHWSCLRDNWSVTRLHLTSLVEARLRSPLCPSLLYPVPTFFKRSQHFQEVSIFFKGFQQLYFQEVTTFHRHQMWLNYRKRVETSKPLQLFLQGRW